MEEKLLIYDPSVSIPDFPVPEGFSDIIGLLVSPYQFNPDLRICESHFLMLGPKTPLNIANVRQAFPELNQETTIDYQEYEHVFYNQTVNFCWYLLPSKLIPNSINKEFDVQLKLINFSQTSEYIPSTAVIEVLKWLLYYKNTGCFCADLDQWARTCSIGSGGDPTLVGVNKKGKICIGHWWIDAENPRIGLGAVRRIYPQKPLK